MVAKNVESRLDPRRPIWKRKFDNFESRSDSDWSNMIEGPEKAEEKNGNCYPRLFSNSPIR